MKRLFIFLALSFGLHLLFESGLFKLADYFLKEQRLTPTTVVELVNTPENISRSRPIIKQLDPINPIDQLSKPARFESEKDQRVHQETQTRNTGLTRNPNRKNTRTSEATKLNQSQNEEDLPEFTRANLQSPSHSQTSQTAALSQILPSDIPFAGATNLNTDANIYYSFYSRVEELFYVRWGERLNYYWNRLAYEFKKKQLSGKVWTTTLEVLLNSSGEYHSAKIFQSSGYKPFDEAAVFAFKDARFFPNPPRAKVEPDGFVRLRYRLSVQVGNLP